MMDDKQEETQKGTVQAENKSIAIGSIDIGGDQRGNITIGHSIGYTAEEVSILIEQIATTFQPKPFDGRCPYKGLDVFEEEDAELFFGREKIVDDLVERVQDSRAVFITGPSGSGKSSLVRAGLIPALKGGALKNSERWRYETVKPGRDPMASLAQAFSRLKSPELGQYFREHIQQLDVLNVCAESALSDQKDQRLVLFFDQFEEVFTQVAREEVRTVFLDLLTNAATVENGRVTILFAMRSDFVSNCATYANLNSLLNEQFVQVGAMGSDELVSAIAQPALRVNLRIDPDLVAQIINDMQGEPGALPLMQFALKDLFDAEQAKGGVITLSRSAYLQREGIQKMLARYADETLSNLSPREQELTKTIFSGLVEIGRGVQDTKRTAELDDLVPADMSKEEVKIVIQKLADARLVTSDEEQNEQYTITHEKLLDAWPWLKKLVNENRDVIGLQNQIAADAKEWEDKKRDSSYLYSGARLANAHEQLDAKKLSLGGLAQEFVQAGYVRHRRSRYLRISTISVIIALLAVAVIIFSNQAKENEYIAGTAQAASTNAIAQQVTAKANALEAQNQSNIARANLSRLLAKQALELLNAGEFEQALLLSLEAYEASPTLEALNSLRIGLESSPYLERKIRPPKFLIPEIAGDKTFNRIYAGEELISRQILDGFFDKDQNLVTIRIVDKDSYGFSPIALSSLNILNGEYQFLYELGKYETSNFSLTGSPVSSVLRGDPEYARFNEDGSRFMVATGTYTSEGDEIAIYNTTTGVAIGKQIDLTGYQVDVDKFIVNREGTLIASMLDDDAIGIWDTITNEFKQRIGGIESSSQFLFTDRGDILVLNGDKTLNLIDVTTGENIINPVEFDNKIRTDGIAISPDQRIIAMGISESANGEESYLLWDMEEQQIIAIPLSDQNRRVRKQVFSSDGELLAYVSYDYPGISVKLIDVTQNMALELISNAFAPSYPEILVFFTPDNQKLVILGQDGSELLLDVQPIQAIKRPLNDLNSVNISEMVFNADSSILFTRAKNEQVLAVDIASNQITNQADITFPHSPQVSWNCINMTRGGCTATIISVEDPLNGQLGFEFDQGDVISTAINPNGETIAVGTLNDSNNDGQIFLINVSNGQQQELPSFGLETINALAFSPDGNFLMAANDGGAIMRYDLTSNRGVYADPLIGNRDFIAAELVFSEDGQLLASASNDNVLLWDVAAMQALVQLPVNLYLDSQASSPTTGLVISPDNRWTAIRTEKEILLWSIDFDYWKIRACQMVGRDFSEDEWKEFFKDTPYHATCSKNE